MTLKSKEDSRFLVDTQPRIQNILFSCPRLTELRAPLGLAPGPSAGLFYLLITVQDTRVTVTVKIQSFCHTVYQV